MDKFLSQPKKTQQPVMLIDEKKLSYFMLRIPAQDYFSYSEQAYISLPAEKKSDLLNRYYHYLYQSCYASRIFFLFFVWLGAFVVSGFFWPVIKILCLFELIFVLSR